MTREEKGLLVLFALFGVSSVVNIGANLVELNKSNDQVINRSSSIAQSFFLVLVLACSYIFFKNIKDDQDDKIDTIKNQRNVRFFGGRGDFFGGRGNYLPPPQIVIDRMQVEGRQDQVEGQPRR